MKKYLIFILSIFISAHISSIAIYKKIKISSVYWFLETKSPMNKIDYFWDESDFPIIIEKNNCQGDYFLESMLRKLTPCGKSKNVDIRISTLLFSDKKIDTLSILRDGKIIFNSKFFCRNDSLIKYLLEYLPQKHIEGLKEAFPDLPNN